MNIFVDLGEIYSPWNYYVKFILLYFQMRTYKQNNSVSFALVFTVSTRISIRKTGITAYFLFFMIHYAIFWDMSWYIFCHSYFWFSYLWLLAYKSTALFLIIGRQPCWFSAQIGNIHCLHIRGKNGKNTQVTSFFLPDKILSQKVGI